MKLNRILEEICLHQIIKFCKPTSNDQNFNWNHSVWKILRRVSSLAFKSFKTIYQVSWHNLCVSILDLKILLLGKAKLFKANTTSLVYKKVQIYPMLMSHQKIMAQIRTRQSDWVIDHKYSMRSKNNPFWILVKLCSHQLNCLLTYHISRYVCKLAKGCQAATCNSKSRTS